jgi:Ca2+/Na+ antiporter
VILLLRNKKHNDSIDVRVSRTLIFSTAGLLSVLVLLLISGRVMKWRMTRAMGVCLLLIYIIVMIANILVEVLRS